MSRSKELIRFAPVLLSLVLLFVVSPILGGNALAQEKQSDRQIPLEADAWALEFGVARNFTLKPFLGSTISFKKHTSAARAWQIGATLEANVQREIERRSSSGNEFRDTTTIDMERVALRGHYLAYPTLGEAREPIQLYVGGGPQISFDRSNAKQTSQSEQTTTETRTEWALGVSGIIGAEWFVHSRISIRGQYRAGLLYQRNQFEEETTDPAHPNTQRSWTTNAVILESGGVQFGVSVYF